MGKVLFIVRGVSGSGKSSLVDSIVKEEYEGEGYIFSTDNYFITENGYEFDPTKLGEYHLENQKAATEAMKEGKSPIFIDNTNLQKWEAKPYVQSGLLYSYIVRIIEPSTEWWKSKNAQELALRNRHGVSEEAIQKMLERYETDFTVENILKAKQPRRRNNK
ncbi:NEDD4-binding protein 2 [Boothiomyces sp. JEL0866]|nr:NEDD4-binding protein 2 [Boothiomyces sp. JEL0866]